MMITLNISVDSALWVLLIIEAYSHLSHQYELGRIISLVVVRLALWPRFKIINFWHLAD